MNWSVQSRWRAALISVMTRAAAFLTASSVTGRGTAGMAQTRQTVVHCHYALLSLSVNCSCIRHLLWSLQPLSAADEECSATDFRCTSGQCVLATMHCDGHPDCRDRSDEEGCTITVACTTKHRCPQSKECLVQEWICDGDQDCIDGTDEKVKIDVNAKVSGQN